MSSQKQKCENCAFFRKGVLNIDGVKLGKESTMCFCTPTAVFKDPESWCGQWKKAKELKIKISATYADNKPVEPVEPMSVECKVEKPAMTHAELTAQVAEILKTKKISILEFSKILEENGLSNLQELASNTDKIPVISKKIAEIVAKEVNKNA